MFGKSYGYEDSEGISPTEREFDAASLHCILGLSAAAMIVIWLPN